MAAFVRIRTICYFLGSTVVACVARDQAGSAPPSLAEYTSPVVLFISPEKSDIDRLREEHGEDFYIIADDVMGYRAQAYELLEAAGIPCVHPDADEALFEIDGEITRFRWAEEERPWFVVFYDGVHEPVILYDIDLPDAVEGL